MGLAVWGWPPKFTLKPDVGVAPDRPPQPNGFEYGRKIIPQRGHGDRRDAV